MYKSVCIHKIILVHVADVTYPWLTTSAKQYQDPCFGSLMDSVNYQQCFLNFPFNLITVANPGEGPLPLIFGPEKLFWETATPLSEGLDDPSPPSPPLISMSGSGHWISQLNHGFFIRPTVVQTQIPLHS